MSSMLGQRWVGRKVKATSGHATSRVIRIAQNLGFPLWLAEGSPSQSLGITDGQAFAQGLIGKKSPVSLLTPLTFPADLESAQLLLHSKGK